LILSTTHYLIPLTAIATIGEADSDEPGKTRLDLCNGDTVWVAMTLEQFRDTFKNAARNGSIIQYMEVDKPSEPIE
jgi:hypothetical protein